MDEKKFLEFINKILEGATHKEYYAQMFHTIWKLSQENPPLGDIKLINSSIKELRYTSKVLTPYKGVRKVTIFGSARIKKGDSFYEQAADVARLLVKRGYMIVTGAGPGIMEAANMGAGRRSSFGFNIKLPFEQHANSYIAKDAKLINFKYFFTRKLAFVKEVDGIVLFPGGLGTHDEAFEVLTLAQTGKNTPMPIVCMDKKRGRYWENWKEYLEKNMLQLGLISAEDFNLFKMTDSVEEACDYIDHFYSNYHSIRYIKEEAVIRIKREIPENDLTKMSEDFKDIIVSADIHSSKPLSIEKDEDHLSHLKRLKFNFNRKNFGRLYKLIERINRY